MRIYLYTFLLFLPCLLMAQTPSVVKAPGLSEGSPESVGLSIERLSRIDKMCEKAISDGHVPGVVALVARKGKIVYQKAFGVSNSKTGDALQVDDIFRIASQTKAITSTAVMMLWEEGRFRLDDPISKWIPEFKDPQVLKTFRYSDTTYTTEPAKSEITIRQLLTHTAGLGYGLIDSDERFTMLYMKEGIHEIASRTPITTEQNIKNLAKLPLHYHPGEKYQYSMGLDVLAYFVEVVSGMRFDEFLQSRLFDPLGMTDTYFYLPKGKESRLVTLEEPSKEGWNASVAQGPYDPMYPIGDVRTIHSGGGGLSCTAKDYATFLQMYLNGGALNGKRYLSRTTIKSMMGNHIADKWGDRGSYYGLAFGVVDEKGEDKGGSGSAGTFSWGGAFNTQYFADPKEEIIGILLKQTSNAWYDQTGWKFKQLVEQAVMYEGAATALTTGNATSVGMSPERLDRIDRICEEAVADNAVPGVVALVAKDGKVVYHKAFGKADNAANRDLKKDDIFRIASQSKAITSTAVMMLWEEGHFKLDDPISKWIPEFKEMKVLKDFKYSDMTYTSEPAKSQITIRQLLSHTSGLGYGAIDGHEGMRLLYEKAGIEEFAAIEELTTVENVKRIASMPLHFQPGEKWQYSMGLDVLGAFIEIVSGKSFDVFVKERIFDPLEMNDTYFHMPQSKANRLVKVQYPDGDQWKHQPVTHHDPSYPLTGFKGFCAGGAGLSSTILDYAKFLQMYLNKGSYNGHQLLSPTTIEAIMGNQIGDFWAGGPKHHGLAFSVVNQLGEVVGGEGSVGTFEWGGYFNTQYFADPEEGVIGLIFKQTQGTWKDQTGWQFRQLVGQAIDN